MKKIMIVSFIALQVAITAGCGTTNNAMAQKTKTVEYYRIFDLKTQANKQVVFKAASDGMGRNVNNSQEATPIPASADLPDKPGRFKITNPFEGSKLAALAGGARTIGLKMAACEGASWTAKAERKIEGSNKLNLTACLFPYKEGYHLNMYAVFSKKEGGLFEVSRQMANAMVGTPEEWTEKTFLDIVRSIRDKANAQVSYLEGQPDLAGTPWLDTGEAVSQAK
jgi:hypothetical protein